jgi:hypothetical protein
LAFPAALSNDGYIDLCILQGKASYLKLPGIFTGFDRGKHFASDEVIPNPPTYADQVQVIYTKVKSFKLLPGIIHKGVDHEALRPELPPLSLTSSAQSRMRTPTIIPDKPKNAADRKFRDKFVLSVDGERYDPGHGIVCEVHQGLASVIGDGRLRKYQPTLLREKMEGDGACDPASCDSSPCESEMKTQSLEEWMKYMDQKFEGPPADDGGASSTGEEVGPSTDSGVDMTEVQITQSH